MGKIREQQKKMEPWYKDNNLVITFKPYPVIIERYIFPYHTEKEKKEILKKPYENLRDLKVEIEYKKENFSFSIPKGFCFDGASIPRLFWRIIGSNTDNRFLIAAMIHDYMCENHEVINNNRYLSTLIFEALLKTGGVKAFQRWIMKHSVDNFQKFCGWGK